MFRNGATRDEICDEMDIDRKHLSVLFHNARKKGVDVPRLKAWQRAAGRPPRVPIETLLSLQAKLKAHGLKGEALVGAMAERTGLSANCIKVRLWRWNKGIRPLYALREQSA
jgi:hypothetical protein